MSEFDAARSRAKRPCPLWVDAFQRDTQHLQADEVGAYMLILMAMWTRAECDFPDDDNRLARVSRVSTRLWRSRIGPVLRPFFTSDDGALISQRLRKEAAYVERHVQQQSDRKAGEKSDKPLKSNDQASTADSTTDEPRTHPTLQPDNPTKKERDKSLSVQLPAIADRFEEFWAVYPHRGGSKKGKAPTRAKYLAAVKRGVPEQTIIDGAARYGIDRQVVQGFAKNPETWINQVGWDDEIEPTQPQLKAITGGRQDDRRQFAEAHREYTRRLASGAIDLGPDESDPFAR